MTARIQSQLRTIDGLSIRFAESEQRTNHALLLSPWPESVYAFESIWSRLAERTHLVAIDLPGFGRSERRDELMSPRAMGEFIIRLADEFDLDSPHVVGPDIGTAASLFAAVSSPGRLRSLTIGSGGTTVPLQLGGVLREWIEAPNLEPYREIDGREIVKMAVATLERYTPTPVALDDYLTSYAGERFAESMRYVRAYPAELPVLRDLLPDILTPVQIIAGRRDEVVPLANAEFLQQRLPWSKVELIEAAHFVWEDAADEYASLLLDWWDGGYLNFPERVAQRDTPASRDSRARPRQ